VNRKAKIVATLGPSSESVDVLRKMILAGVDVARFNFSHGTHQQHKSQMQIIRALGKEIGKPVSILQDLSGPKMRVGDLPEMGVELNDGKAIHFTTSQLLSNFSNQKELFIPLDVPSLFESLKPGNHILLMMGKWT